MENLNAWKDEENKTKLLAAFILGTLFFWVPGYACDVADAFTNEKCLPRSIYLLSTFLFNVSHCVKPLIIAAIDGDFATEFKRILKFRKIRRVVDVNVQGNKLGGDPKFMPETRKYYCQTEDDDANLTKANDSNVWSRDKPIVLPFCRSDATTTFTPALLTLQKWLICNFSFLPALFIHYSENKNLRIDQIITYRVCLDVMNPLNPLNVRGTF